MPAEKTILGAIPGIGWQCNKWLALPGVIVTPVLVVFFDSSADFNVIARRNREIAPTKQNVDIGSQQKSIAGFVATGFVWRLNV